jgi:hypothetical protein
MEPTIKPDPNANERAAILAALELLAEDGFAGVSRSGWREAGIRENVDETPDGCPSKRFGSETGA